MAAEPDTLRAALQNAINEIRGAVNIAGLIRSGLVKPIQAATIEDNLTRLAELLEQVLRTPPRQNEKE